MTQFDGMTQQEFNAVFEELADGCTQNVPDRVKSNYYRRFKDYNQQVFKHACVQAADLYDGFPSKRKLLALLPVLTKEQVKGCSDCVDGLVVSSHGDWRYGPDSMAERCTCPAGQALSATIPTTGKVYG